jgi:uncharacterized membrane protein YdjX (TVP38/TMEM64 family)
VTPPVDRAGRPPRLSRYLLLSAAVLTAFLLVFLLAEALSLPLTDEPTGLLAGGGAVTAAVGVGLLVVDVVLPVPSSLVMVAHGALFGIALGAVLSLVGAVGAALAGYCLGQWTGPPVVRRVCSAAEREQASVLVGTWGLFAVVASRPVPLLAETVAVVAGAERLGVWRVAGASAVGALPGAVLYAAAGALGGTGPSGAVVFGAVLVIAALLWALGRTRPGLRSDGPTMQFSRARRQR